MIWNDLLELSNTYLPRSTSIENCWKAFFYKAVTNSFKIVNANRVKI